MDYTGRTPVGTVPDPLEVDTVKATSLCTDTFCLPPDAGLEGQVLTSDGSGNTTWDNGTGNKGDLLYVNDIVRIVDSNPVGTGVTQSQVPLNPGIGSLTIPANTINKGDVYVFELLGDYLVPSSSPDKYLLVEFTINDTVVAAAGNGQLIRSIQPSTPTTSAKSWRSLIYLTFKGLPTEGINAVVEGFTSWADFEADDTRTRRFEGGENITVDGSVPNTLGIRVLCEDDGPGQRLRIVTRHLRLKKLYTGTAVPTQNQTCNTFDDVQFNVITADGNIQLSSTSDINKTIPLGGFDYPATAAFQIAIPPGFETGQLAFYGNGPAGALTGAKITTNGVSLNNISSTKTNSLTLENDWKFESSPSTNLTLKDASGVTPVSFTQSAGANGNMVVHTDMICRRIVDIDSSGPGIDPLLVFADGQSRQWYISSKSGQSDSLVFGESSNDDPVLTLNQNKTVTIGHDVDSYTLPPSRGIADQVLTSDGIGSVYWKTPEAKIIGGYSFFGNTSPTTFLAGSTGVWEGFNVDVTIINGVLVNTTSIAGGITNESTETRYFTVNLCVAWEDGGSPGSDIFTIAIQKFPGNTLTSDSRIRSQLDGTNVYPRAASTQAIVELAPGEGCRPVVACLSGDAPVLIVDALFSIVAI